MTRRIVLDLAEDATDTECGSCQHDERSMAVPFAHVCRATGYLLPVINDRSVRVNACLEAEQEAARMVEIDPEDARLIDSVGPKWTSVDDRVALKSATRVSKALREHGRKAR